MALDLWFDSFTFPAESLSACNGHAVRQSLFQENVSTFTGRSIMTVVDMLS